MALIVPFPDEATHTDKLFAEVKHTVILQLYTDEELVKFTEPCGNNLC